VKFSIVRNQFMDGAERPSRLSILVRAAEEMDSAEDLGLAS